MPGAHDGSRGLRAAKVWNEPPTMDEELREMIELARVEAQGCSILYTESAMQQCLTI